MSPARHETSIGPGQLDGADDKTPYGTRGSKRKAAELSTAPTSAPSSTSPKLTSRATKSRATAKKSNEPHLPPAKKRRSSPTPSSAPEGSSQLSRKNSSADQSQEIDDAVENGRASKTPSANHSSATPGPDGGSFTQEVPEITLGEANGASDDVANEPVADEEIAEPTNGTGRGGFRGRGRGRGGRWKGRGSRGGKTKVMIAKAGPKTAVPVMKGKGRGRGGRRKKPENPRIDTLAQRKTDLKAQYKALASLQRAALGVLGEKSKEMLLDDAKYHESLPEFQRVAQGLQQAHEQRQGEIARKEEMEIGLAKRTQEYNEYLIHQQLDLRIEEVKEKYDSQIKEHAAYIYVQAETKAPLDDVPFSRGEDGRMSKQLNPPPRVVNWFANPFLGPQPAVSSMRVTAGGKEEPITKGDTEDQHPANWWLGKTKRQRADILKTQTETRLEKEKQFGIAKKTRGKNALFQPTSQQAFADDGDDVEPGDDDEADIADPTQPTGDDGLSDSDNDASEDNEDGDAPLQAADAYGVVIPRKKTRKGQFSRANRIVAYAPVTYEPHEIGLQLSHFQKPNQLGRLQGREPSPNAKDGKIYYDQRQNRYNAGKNQLGDLDQAIVAAHKLHPRLGLPIKGSINPDHDACEAPYLNFNSPTDWTKPLENSNPVMVVQKNQKKYDDEKRIEIDGGKTVYRTSRSEWHYRAERAFDQLSVSQKMKALLEESRDLVRPSTPIIEEPELPISEDLLQAAQAAIENDTQEEENRRVEQRQAETARRSAARQRSQNRAPQPGPPMSPYRTPFSPTNSGYSPRNMAATSPIYSSPRAMGQVMMNTSPIRQNHPVIYSPQHSMAPPPPPPTVPQMPPPQRYDPVRDQYSSPYANPPPPPPTPQTPRPIPYAAYQPNTALGALADLADHATINPPPPPPYNMQNNPYHHTHTHPQPQLLNPQPQILNQQPQLLGHMNQPQLLQQQHRHPGMGVFANQPTQQYQYMHAVQGPARGGGNMGTGAGRNAQRTLRPAPPQGQSPQQQQQSGPPYGYGRGYQ